MSSLKGPGAPQTHDGSGLRIAIVHARWNDPIISALVTGTRTALLHAGVLPQNIITQDVPGSYELPFAVQRIYAASQVESTNAQVGSVVGGVADLLGVGGVEEDLRKDSTGAVDPSGITYQGVRAKKEEAGKGEERKEGMERKSTAAFDAVIAIGVLIKGETMHFEYIAEAVSQGLMRVGLDAGVPVIFGLLTVLDEKQAMMRAGMKLGGHNHGEDWGRAAVELGVKRREWNRGAMA